jgi:phage virion morphogenesis protein
MMPVDMTIKAKDLGAERQIAEMLARVRNLRPATKVIGEAGLASIQRNFEEGGRPKKWKSLAAATIKQRRRQKKWPGQILVRRGVSGGLLGSISYRAYPSKVRWSAKKIYAAIQHLGGRAGRGHKVKIPARAYMLMQREDRGEFIEILRDYIFEGRA